MMIDNGFSRYLRQILGDEVLAKMKAGDATPFNSVMRHFNKNIKPYFCSAQQWDDGVDDGDNGVDNIINISGEYIEPNLENDIIDTVVITG
jgi:hypothetical protein